MENKILNFHIYRYHLLPIDTQTKQSKIFEQKSMTFSEIKNNKNIFFSNILQRLVDSKNNKNPLKLDHNENEHYLFKVAQKKKTRITQNFESKKISNEPYSYVIINNDPKVQKIAISDNADAFSDPNVVRNILKKIFVKDLEAYGLNIEIEQLFSSKDFWGLVRKHQLEITYLNFQFIKPNLANISHSLSSAFRNFTDEVNSHESQLSIKAPEKGALEKIDSKNKTVSGLVDYTSNGGGNIKMKVKGLRKMLSTKENPIILEIGELELEGTSSQIIKVYQTILEE